MGSAFRFKIFGKMAALKRLIKESKGLTLDIEACQDACSIQLLTRTCSRKLQLPRVCRISSAPADVP
jgi:hypothetical protein